MMINAQSAESTRVDFRDSRLRIAASAAYHQQKQYQKTALAAVSAREVYHTVVAPTVFPPAASDSNSNTATNNGYIFYQQKTLRQMQQRPSNGNYDYQQITSISTANRADTLASSFRLQDQLHQHCQQQRRALCNVSNSNSRGDQQRSGPVFGVQDVKKRPVAPVMPQASFGVQQMNSPSPKRSTRHHHHHGHGHHGQRAQNAGGFDLLEAEALQKRHKYPTNFCRMLRECPPPVPPILLRTLAATSSAVSAIQVGGRAQAGALPRHKDPANRLKITVRVLSSTPVSDVGTGSPDAGFLTVDTRKKQVTLMEPNQQPQRSLAASVQQQTAGSTVPKIFGFDAVFSPEDSQTEICSTALTEIMQTVVNDGDGCVLIYGSADQGKQNTVIGSDNNAQSVGVLPCAVSWLYRLINENKQKSGARFSIRVSAVEIFGAQEDLRDLLVDLASVSNSASSNSQAVACLREDPVFGTQLENVCELRAPTADKAAFYLDAALAKRRAGTEEERRNSHFFFTLHIYQYRVSEHKEQQQHPGCAEAGVAGGRTRLHLIDLGAGEKNSKPGRASLTLPALGNILLTLLQGQKHLPFRESKVTQVLKGAIGSASCKAVSVVACASADQERYMESVNVVQIAGRLYRIRRTKKGGGKFGFGNAVGNSSGGESSTDERNGRRRFPRSASDPDCTTSSSEQSCDTVIYLGAGGSRSKPGSSATGTSNAVAISDQDIPPLVEQTVCASPARMVKKYPPPGPVTAGARLGPKPLPASAVLQEQWIDGPKASKQPKLLPPPGNENRLLAESDTGGISGKLCSPSHHHKNAVPMDPFKREMIRQWVVLQEQERASSKAGEIWIDRAPLGVEPMNFEGTGARPKTTQFLNNLATFGIARNVCADNAPDRRSVHSVSMETSSSERSPSYSDVAVADTRDVALQCCEEEIDSDCARYTIPVAVLQESEMTVFDQHHTHNNNTVNQEYMLWTEPEMRMLEDIAEVEEEELASDGTPMASSRRSSSLQAVLLGSANPPYRNEGMVRPSEAVSVLLTAPSTSSVHSLSVMDEEPEDEHPLRILSCERMAGNSRSDSFSLGNDDTTDAFSLPTSDTLIFGNVLTNADGKFLTTHNMFDEDSSSLTDEDLERAMQASLTSIRSHEILEKLKTEGQLRRTREEAQQTEKSEQTRENRKENCVFPENERQKESRPKPDGVEEKTEKIFKEKPSKIVDLHGRTKNANFEIEKLTKPTVPQLPKPIANMVTSQLISGLAQKEDKAKVKKVQNLQQPPVLRIEDTQTVTNVVPGAHSPRSASSSLPRPTKLASPRLKDQTVTNEKIVSKNIKESHPTKTMFSKGEKEKEKEKTKSNSTSKQEKSSPKTSSLKSPIMSFLRSPSKFHKKAQNAPVIDDNSAHLKSDDSTSRSSTVTQKRASSGYDSGHDSGIVTADSPDLHVLASPYSKITKPRASQRSSSGHGSDNSSAVSSDTGLASNAKTSKLYQTATFAGKTAKKTMDRTSTGNASSSGYESASGRKSEDEQPKSGCLPKVTSPVSDSETDRNGWSPSHERVRSPPSIKLHRKKLLEGFNFHVSKSRSAPQSPSTSKGGNICIASPTKRGVEPSLLSETCIVASQSNSMVPDAKSRMAAIKSLKTRQTELKNELKLAKERLCIPACKWSYDLHVSECMDPSNPTTLEALQQETKILEKRVAACKSHVLMVTVFDAVPSLSSSPSSSRKCT